MHEVRNHKPHCVSPPGHQSAGSEVGLVVEVPDPFEHALAGFLADVAVVAQDLRYRNHRNPEIPSNVLHPDRHVSINLRAPITQPRPAPCRSRLGAQPCASFGAATVRERFLSLHCANLIISASKPPAPPLRTPPRAPLTESSCRPARFRGLSRPIGREPGSRTAGPNPPS